MGGYGAVRSSREVAVSTERPSSRTRWAGVVAAVLYTHVFVTSLMRFPAGTGERWAGRVTEVESSDRRMEAV